MWWCGEPNNGAGKQICCLSAFIGYLLHKLERKKPRAMSTRPIKRRPKSRANDMRPRRSNLKAKYASIWTAVIMSPSKRKKPISRPNTFSASISAFLRASHPALLPLASLEYPIVWRVGCTFAWHPPPKFYILGMAAICSLQH